VGGGLRGLTELVAGVVAGAACIVATSAIVLGTVPSLQGFYLSWVIQWTYYVLIEEMIFRGLLLRGLDRATGSVLALVLSSVVFALAHHVYAPTPLIFHAAVGAFVGTAFLYTRRLWLSVGVHAGINLALIATGLAGTALWASSAIAVAAAVGIFVIAARQNRVVKYGQSMMSQWSALRPRAQPVQDTH
jgi:membrane protease YdiL (CAAX protease family)